MNSRGDMFDNLIEPVKDLLISIYGSRDNFVKSQPNMLEDLLIEYDTYAGDEQMVKLLSQRIGLIIPKIMDFDLYFLSSISYAFGIISFADYDPQIKPTVLRFFSTSS